MSPKSGYLVPARTVSLEQEIKNSKFITTAGRASSEEEARQFIERVCKKYPDATHNCYVYIAGDPGGTTQVGMSDDGEVPGTAAKPMMSVLSHKKIGEIVVVVTRYFGGTKLGTGGLVRAYSDSVQSVLEELPLIRLVESKSGELTFPYSYENSMRYLFDNLSVKIEQIIYGQDVKMKINVPEYSLDEIESRIAELTSGRIKILWK